jgi:NADP-reducing hydrogenase subunit HndB
MNLEDLKKIREKREKDMVLRDGKSRIKVVIGMGTSGIAAGARQTMRTFWEEIEKRGLQDVVVTQSGERGLSSKEPIVSIQEEGKSMVVYGGVTSDVARKIVAEHLVNGKPISEFILEIQKQG